MGGRGADNRVSGLIPKTSPPRGKLPEMDADSKMTGGDNPTQIRKTAGEQATPTITYSDSTQEMKLNLYPRKDSQWNKKRLRKCKKSNRGRIAIGVIIVGVFQ